MSLDELIETLADFRRHYPSAGTASVACSVDLATPVYEHGIVSFADDVADVPDLAGEPDDLEDV